MNDILHRAAAHNESIDRYINVTLREHFGGERVTARQWFEAQQMIRAQDFFGKGLAICREMRAAGYDCRIDGQSGKLHCPGGNIMAY
ncbi:MAG: hypothetical protein J6K32_08260 [Clostridia bacterium]|nr:hypothetical protein [Clostridia bacterium]